MVNVSEINSASSAVRLKSKDCYIKKISQNQFRVTPKSYRKSRRIVAFLPNGMALCVEAHTGTQCKANEFGVPCYHLIRAASHLIHLAQRKSK